MCLLVLVCCFLGSMVSVCCVSVNGEWLLRCFVLMCVRMFRVFVRVMVCWVVLIVVVNVFGDNIDIIDLRGGLFMWCYFFC